jgi:hypothetical protein
MYQKDYSIFGRVFYITSVISVIVFFCSVMADTVCQPIQVALGATGQQIQESSNVHMILTNLWKLPLFFIVIYTVAFLLLRYLECYHPDDGFLPYKRDLDGNRIRKTFIQHPYINQCYDTYDEFMEQAGR